MKNKCHNKTIIATKKAYIFLLAFVLILISVFSISNNLVFADGKYPQLVEEPFINIYVYPDEIINNLTDTKYTYKQQSTFDFLLSDNYTFVTVKIPDEFSDGIINFSLSPFSTNSSVAIAPSTSDDWFNKITFAGVGSCYVDYSGTFIDTTTDASYSFSGKILFNIVCEKATTLAVNTRVETVENREIKKYSAVVNNNENLTAYYDREKIVWKSNGNIVGFGSTLIDDNCGFSNNLTCTYNNTSWIEGETTENDIIVSVNKISNEKVLDKFWWLYDLLLISAIALVIFLNSKIERLPSIKLAQKNLISLQKATENLEKVTHDPKAKQKKIDKSFSKCTTYLTLAKGFCDSAVKEDYYELKSSSDLLVQLDEKMAILDKSKKKINNEKLLNSCKKIVQQSLACLEVIDATIKGQEKAEQNLVKDRQVEYDLENKKNKDIIKKMFKRKKKVSAEQVLEELGESEMIQNNENNVSQNNTKKLKHNEKDIEQNVSVDNQSQTTKMEIQKNDADADAVTAIMMQKAISQNDKDNNGDN